MATKKQPQKWSQVELENAYASYRDAELQGKPFMQRDAGAGRGFDQADRVADQGQAGQADRAQYNRLNGVVGKAKK